LLRGTEQSHISFAALQRLRFDREITLLARPSGERPAEPCLRRARVCTARAARG